MILLDTNIISESMRPAPEIKFKEWIDNQVLETLYLSTITVAELRAGVSQMPKGKRKNLLGERIEKKILPMFAGRVLSFDIQCSTAYAKVIANVKKAGSGIQTADALIAAVALAYRFKIATRDENPFLAAGIDVINPWLQ